MKIDVELSPREFEIADYVGFTGKSQKEVADDLGISIKTVNNTLQKVYDKAGINKATELTKFCFCRRFNIPLSMCEPFKKIVAASLLILFVFGELMHTNVSSEFVIRRARRARTELSMRRTEI